MGIFLNIQGSKKQIITDEELLQEFRSEGNLEALGELYGRYMHLVYGVCLKYFKEREEAKDAVMQIFEKLITAIPGTDIINFRSWLHVVTRNFCLMQLRSGRSVIEKHTVLEKNEPAFMENEYNLHPVDEDEIEKDKMLTDCISKLKDEQRESIRQFYYENRSYNEIACIMGIDEKKVKSLLQNAKRNLKLCLEEKHVRER